MLSLHIYRAERGRKKLKLGDYLSVQAHEQCFISHIIEISLLQAQFLPFINHCFIERPTCVSTVTDILPPYVVRILFITGMTCCPSGTARLPPGRKQFWTSIINRAVLTALPTLTVQSRVTVNRLKQKRKKEKEIRKKE